MKTYIIKAIVHFEDGVNKGQFEVKARDEEGARKEAINKMIRIWNVSQSSIDILSIKKK